MSVREVRTEAGEVLVGDNECFQHLIQGLRDPDPRMRRLAVCGLAAAGDPRAVEPSVERLDDEDPTVRARAREALEKIRETPVF